MKKIVFGSLLVAGMAIGGIFLLGGNSAKASEQDSELTMAVWQCPCPSYCAGGWLPVNLCDGACSTLKCTVRPDCYGCTP